MWPIHLGAVKEKNNKKNPGLLGCKGCFCPIIQTTNILPILEMGSTPSPNPTIPQQPSGGGPFPQQLRHLKPVPTHPFQFTYPYPGSPPFPTLWAGKWRTQIGPLAWQKPKLAGGICPSSPLPGLTVYCWYKKTTPHWIRRCFEYGYTTGKINTHAQTVPRDQCLLLPHHSHSPPRPLFCNLLSKMQHPPSQSFPKCRLLANLPVYTLGQPYTHGFSVSPRFQDLVVLMSWSGLNPCDF